MSDYKTNIKENLVINIKQILIIYLCVKRQRLGNMRHLGKSVIIELFVGGRYRGLMQFNS